MNIEKKLYQWDTEQKLTGCTGLYVDFPIDNEVYRVETIDGTCIIPDELLQTSGGHKVYECMTNNTIRSFAFSVTPRPKPPDYVYTPTERLTFEGLVQRVDDAVADMIRRAESGEFDGHTPVKGTDYFTTGEIQQIQNEVSSGAIGEFKSVVDTETETFNTNAESKLTTYNENDVAKTGAYNTNASNKVTEYNSNAENKTAEFDTHTEQIQADISELKSDINNVEKAYNNYFNYNLAYRYKLGVLVSTGDERPGTTRIITPYVKTPVGTKISVASGYKYRIYAYTTPSIDGHVGTSMSGKYHTEDFEINDTFAGYYLRYMVAKSDDSTIDDVDAVASKLSILHPATRFDLVELVENVENEKQDKSVPLGVNLIDAEHPTHYNSAIWTYSNGVWAYVNSSFDNLRFDIEVEQAGEYTVMFDLYNTVGNGVMTIRTSENVILHTVNILPSHGGHIEFEYTFETVGIYRILFTGNSATACGTISKIMVAQGVQKEYVPYSETVDNAVKAIRSIMPELDVVEQKVASETDIKGYNLSALKTYEKAVKAIDADIKIPLMTDCHTDNIETYEMLYHMANSGASDFCVNLGDYIPAYYDSLADCIALFEKVARNYNTIPTKVDVNFLKGNHDNNVVGNSDSSAFVSNADFYNQLEWREKSVVGKTNKAYGYRDIEHAKIRVIMLDASDIYDTDGTRLSANSEVQILQPQFEWFVNEALDFSDKANPTSWEVLIMSHASLQTLCRDAFRAVLDAFQSGGSVSGAYTANSAGYEHTLTANKDFSSQGAVRVICTVSGHQHADMIKQLGTTIPISEVYVACENQSAYYLDENNEQVWYTRTAGTILEHCIETICVQRDSGKVVFKRLGIGSDREISY